MSSSSCFDSCYHVTYQYAAAPGRTNVAAFIHFSMNPSFHPHSQVQTGFCDTANTFIYVLEFMIRSFSASCQVRGANMQDFVTPRRSESSPWNWSHSPLLSIVPFDSTSFTILTKLLSRMNEDEPGGQMSATRKGRRRKLPGRRGHGRFLGVAIGWHSLGVVAIVVLPSVPCQVGKASTYRACLPSPPLSPSSG